MSHKDTFAQRFPGVTSILRNGALLTGTQWGETLIRAVYAVLIGRLLGPDLYGTWSLALATYAFAIGFTHFGLESIIPLRLGRDKAAPAFLGTTFVVRLVLLALAVAATAAYVLSFETDLFSRWALLLVLPALVGRGVVLWARSVFVGLESNRIAFQFSISLRLFELVAGLTSIWLGFGLYVLLLLHAATWLVEACLVLISLSRRGAFAIRFERTEFREFGARGAVLGLGSTGMGALLSLPIILTRYISDDISAVGQIAMAIQVASLVVMAVHSCFTAALPIVSRAVGSDDPRLRYYALLTGLGGVVVFGLAIVVSQAFGPLVFSRLLGDEFALAGAWLTPALVAAGIMVLPTGLLQLLIARDRVWSLVVASWTGVLGLVAALPGFVEVQGPSGALYAAALGWAFYGAVLIFWSLGTREKQV